MPETNTELLAIVAALQAQVKELSERLARLEANSGAAVAVVAPVLQTAAPVRSAEPAVKAAAQEPISEEVLLLISAAVAAFLGERRRIRQIRLLNSSAWALQGRVSIQASHRLAH